MKHLAKDFHYVAVDLPMHGRSAHIVLSMTAVMEEVEALLKYYKKVHLVRLSLRRRHCVDGAEEVSGIHTERHRQWNGIFFPGKKRRVDQYIGSTYLWAAEAGMDCGFTDEDLQHSITLQGRYQSGSEIDKCRTGAHYVTGCWRRGKCQMQVRVRCL